MPICALCKATVDKLELSHIMPAWLYKQARENSGALKNPNPIHVSVEGATPVFKQMKERLLCKSCEDIFNRGGESYVSRIAYKETGECPLLDLLDKRPTRAPMTEVGIGSADVSKLTHFGAGILWRASVTTQIPGCRLPPRPRERLRRYILGETEFPQEFALVLTVLDQPRSTGEQRYDRLFTLPTSNPCATILHFAAAGLYFLLFPYTTRRDERGWSLPVARRILVVDSENYPGALAIRRTALAMFEKQRERTRGSLRNA